MVPKGSSPETYDPIPQQLVSLGDSKAYFRIEYIGFEQTWMDRLMNNTPHIQAVSYTHLPFILSNPKRGKKQWLSLVNRSTKCLKRTKQESYHTCIPVSYTHLLIAQSDSTLSRVSAYKIEASIGNNII